MIFWDIKNAQGVAVCRSDYRAGVAYTDADKNTVVSETCCLKPSTDYTLRCASREEGGKGWDSANDDDTEEYLLFEGQGYCETSVEGSFDSVEYTISCN